METKIPRAGCLLHVTIETVAMEYWSIRHSYPELLQFTIKTDE